MRLSFSTSGGGGSGVGGGGWWRGEGRGERERGLCCLALCCVVCVDFELYLRMTELCGKHSQVEECDWSGTSGK